MRALSILIGVIALFAFIVHIGNESERRKSITPEWTQTLTMKCPTRTEEINAILNSRGKAIYYSVKDTGYNYTRSGFETNFFNCAQVSTTQPQKLNEVTAKRYFYMAVMEYPEGI